MPIRFHIYWLMIAVAIAAVPLALYANDPEQAGSILTAACFLGIPPCVVSLIAIRRVAIRFRDLGQPVTRSETVAFFMFFILFGFIIWSFLFSIVFEIYRIFTFQQ